MGGRGLEGIRGTLEQDDCSREEKSRFLSTLNLPFEFCAKLWMLRPDDTSRERTVNVITI